MHKTRNSLSNKGEQLVKQNEKSLTRGSQRLRDVGRGKVGNRLRPESWNPNKRETSEGTSQHAGKRDEDKREGRLTKSFCKVNRARQSF